MGQNGSNRGNFMELHSLSIHFLPDGDEAHIPDWEILTRILRKLRRKVGLCSITVDEPDDHREIESSKVSLERFTDIP